MEKKYESLPFRTNAAQINNEIHVVRNCCFLLLILGYMKKKYESLLFRGDAAQIFKI